ncbi:hypothetical protein ACVGVM_11510 [Pseudonocardia bannensis]|uniref:Uncharacterized protein n=1 Tax=Pseudonocardia bannensis TaxID=630973 RepID=A0A848DIH6_9PSEU|nr:hypothetical protein [Pseudonocardia bannensis]NMH92497.1 hypothetical protein [Pseudonocardia bannensis]
MLSAEPMSRSRLADAICAHLGRPDLAGPLSTGWGALLKPAAARGLLCSGPADGSGTAAAGEDPEPALAHRRVGCTPPRNR